MKLHFTLVFKLLSSKCTVKFLVEISPHRYIMLLSNCYGGRTSPNKMVPLFENSDSIIVKHSYKYCIIERQPAPGG